MLVENSLFGAVDKAEIAIERIKLFSDFAQKMNPEGYFVCISGGKDSAVIMDLVIRAKVPAAFYHQHTGIDHPETIYFIRREKTRAEALGYTFKINIPRYRDGTQRTMWKGIETYGLPSRQQRWCCRRLKEFGGTGRYCITGVRWAESARRKKDRGIHEHIQKHTHLNNDNDMSRKLSETCLIRQKMLLNPIIDWSDDEVWEYIHARNLPMNPLYALGFKRVGCIGCPLPNTNDIEQYPRFYALYKKSAAKFIAHKKEIGSKIPAWMSTPEKYMETWINGAATVPPGLVFSDDDNPPNQS
jgi:phosphoadenosine phosphosulfate reductase